MVCENFVKIQLVQGCEIFVKIQLVQCEIAKSKSS